jgi:hypothetical protein
VRMVHCWSNARRAALTHFMQQIFNVSCVDTSIGAFQRGAASCLLWVWWHAMSMWTVAEQATVTVPTCKFD